MHVDMRLKPDMALAIEEYRASQRPIPTRSGAVRCLLMMGLMAARNDGDPDGQETTASRTPKGSGPLHPGCTMTDEGLKVTPLDDLEGADEARAVELMDLGDDEREDDDLTPS